ncbi:MAG: GAF domain-containing protein [Planctomycetota bacterium]
METNLPMVVRAASPGALAHANRTFTEEMGLRAEDLAERPLLEWIHPDDRACFQRVLDRGEHEGTFQARHATRDGNWVAFEWRIRSEDHDLVALGRLQRAGSSGANRSTTTTSGSEDTLAETLKAMALIVEDQYPGKLCSIILVSKAGRVSVGAGPSLPATYNAAVEGLMIGPAVGSCGTASYWNVPVIVEDIQNDPLWKDLREHAGKAGVAACWSHPITAESGEVLGAMAVYNREPSSPTQQETDGLESAARMIGLAVERGRVEQALRESETNALRQSRLLSAVSAAVTSFVDTGDWRSASTQLVQAAQELTRSEYGFIGTAEESEFAPLTHEDILRGLEADGLPQFTGEETGDFLANLNDLYRQVIASSRPVLVNDLDDTEAENTEAKLRNFIGVPVIHGDEVVAVIGIANTEHSYSEEDLDASLVLCRSASGLLDSHRRRQHEEILEEQLLQASKMESLGRLCGGVAHEFNNLLTVILSNALTLSKTTVDPNGLARQISTAAERAAELTKHLLAFSRKQVFELKEHDLTATVLDSLRLLGPLLGEHIKVRFLSEGPNQSFPVKIDATQFGQVIMNLAVNARDAMPQGGTLEVKLSSETIGGRAYALLTVRDSGMGMDPKIVRHIFEPFFSTKDVTGTGLGLSTSYGVVKQLGGEITVDSTLGEGTAFRVSLPLLDPSLHVTDSSQRLECGGETILLVEDDPLVRPVIRWNLERDGYTVLEADSLQNAVKWSDAHNGNIDLLLTDILMPNGNGLELAALIQKSRPGIHVLYMSGYTADDLPTGLSPIRGEFLQKPFSFDTLAQKIRSIIDDAEAEPESHRNTS